jgi:protein TonB
MNRVFPVCFLAALLIHWAILWAWESMPTPVISSQEPPSAEIEITEEQIPADPTPVKQVDQPIKEQPQTEQVKEPAEAVPDPLLAPVPQPTPSPTPLPTPRATPQPAPEAKSSLPPKPHSTPPPKASKEGLGNAVTAATRSARSTGKDRTHASWRNRVTPSYPPSALAARKLGRVMVTVQINALGQATAASVSVSSGNPVLDSAAVRAARESTYLPKCLLGVPLSDTVVIPYNFDIQGR